MSIKNRPDPNCAIAKGIEFVMNGANHRMDCITTYPFYIMGGDWGSAIAPVKDELPLKGDSERYSALFYRCWESLSSRQETLR